MSKRTSKLKHFKALYRKLQKYDDHDNHSVLTSLKCTRAEHNRRTVFEQVIKIVCRRYNARIILNPYDVKRCQNKPKFRWHNWEREMRRAERLARVKANGN